MHEPDDPDGKDAPAKPTDVVLVGDASPQRKRCWPVLRHRQDRVELGEIRAMVEGEPMAARGEVVKLKPRPEHQRLFDVEVLASLEPEATEPAKNGPPQVASAAYRLGWDVTFGKGDN